MNHDVIMERFIIVLTSGNADLNRDHYHPGVIALKKFNFLILRKNCD